MLTNYLPIKSFLSSSTSSGINGGVRGAAGTKGGKASKAGYLAHSHNLSFYKLPPLATHACSALVLPLLPFIGNLLAVAHSR